VRREPGQETGVPCIRDSRGGRSHPQCPPLIPDRGFSDPKPGIVAELIGHFALAALKRFGKPVRCRETDADGFARIVEQGYLRRVVSIV
jgi:hypothetical protein